MAVLKTNGATFSVNTTGSTYVSITKTESFNLSIDQTAITYKTLDSVWQDATVGTKSASGSVTFLYDPDNTTDQSYIVADFVSASMGAVINVRATLTDATPTTLTMSVVFTNFSTSVESDGILKATINFTVNGAITKA